MKNTRSTNNKNLIKLLTLDLETRRLDNGQLEVISSAIYDGKDYYAFYLLDYTNQSDLLKDTVRVLTNPKYKGYKVYIHNLSGFDGIFLFKHILDLNKQGFDVTFYRREDKFISITISNKVTKFKITLYDSYLLLPHKLSTLAKAFNVSDKLEYNIHNNDTASLFDPTFKSKLLEYNNQDCKVLYDVMIAFNKTSDRIFKLSIFDSPTLPSLAFKLFKTKFLKDKVEVTWAEDYVNYKDIINVVFIPRNGDLDIFINKFAFS
jgi:hypothetical protein